jgi:hypothetical protein
MIGKFFSIHDIETEQQAMDAAQFMVREAIDATNTRRGRVRKMRECQNNLNKLIGLCHAEKWEQPLGKLKDTFTTLESAVMKDFADMFSISNQ